jgi:hypothetical protein
MPGPDKQPVLLSGGNPQISKGYGDEKVQEYIDAIADWRGEVCRTVDRLITEAVPDVVKAVKWNSPFYGRTEKDWFVGFHIMTKYVKVAFPDGAELDPLPPGKSKQPKVRYLDIYEDKGFDHEQFLSWIRQAHALPGEKY